MLMKPLQEYEHGCCRAFLIALPLMISSVTGCGGTNETLTPRPLPKAAPVQLQSADLNVRLIGAVGAEAGQASLVRDPGWLEYLLEIENGGDRPVTVRNVKLLTPQGRYLNSATEYQELEVPPDAATELAEDIAVRSAGIAAGQVIPYGGAIVGILSGAASASAAQTEANARREFALRRIKDVELAPGGRMKGSAFLPRIQDPKALALDWGRGDETRRVELPLGTSR